MYPIKLQPVYHERIWGGKNLSEIFGRTLPSDKIGESWELCCHKHGMSVVANGELAGASLEELIKIYKGQLLGNKYREECTAFPIMIKILDSYDKLSIQVHPEDEYAYREEQEPGKSEAWYVAAAGEGAKIVYGINESMTKEDFVRAIKEHRVPETLRYVPVKTGDMVFVPAGTVHALLGGVVVYEVQQNSDTTYRVYDFDRVDAAGNKRELHIDKAIEVIHFGKQEPIDFDLSVINCAQFYMERKAVSREITEMTEGGFIIYCIIGGRGELSYKDYMLKLAPGETILVPACLESITIKGQMELLKIK